MNHIPNIEAHLAHAKEKHPHFADELITPTTRDVATLKLEEIRAQLRHENNLGKVWAEDVLLCELWEVMEAYSKGKKAQAIEECYDAIAVLLRMAEWINDERNAENAK